MCDEIRYKKLSNRLEYRRQLYAFRFIEILLLRSWFFIWVFMGHVWHFSQNLLSNGYNGYVGTQYQSIKQVYCTEPCYTHTINLTNKNKREKSHT